MPPLLFPLPSTSQLTFSSLLVDPSNSYGSVLAAATAARTKLHLALKAVAEKQAGASALAVVDGYLPYVQGIAECLDADTLLYKGDPVFGWRAPLTNYALGSPLLPMPSVQAEHVWVLITYTLALSNHAHSILAALPSFEPSPGSTAKPHLSTDDEKRIAAGLARAVDLLCQASGVALYAAEHQCQKLAGVRLTNGRLGKHKWPAELSEDACRGLSMILLADAHVTAIRKLLLPILPHVLFSPPGPPLPSNHPSPSLLAKLYLHVSELYDSARAYLRTNAPESGSKKLFSSRDKDLPEDPAEGDVIPELKRYLRKEAVLSAGLGRKWLGVDAGENGKGAKIGEALAWVKDAQSRLQELEDGAVREKMKGLSFGKGSDKRKEERKSRKGRLERELDDVAAWIRSYQQMNDTVSFQPVPPASSLTIPSGRPIFTAKVFTPAPNKLRPISLNEDEEEAVETPKAVEEYAGKGNYF